MRVQITKCGDEWWYKNRIGDKFLVLNDPEDPEFYLLENDPAVSIYKTDCIILTGDEHMPRHIREVEEKTANPLDIQIGGDHYKGFKIQPVEFSTVNDMGFLQGCIIKRVCRFNLPTGKGIEDLQKSKHELDLLIKFELEKKND